jgi:hypothetical protein
VGSEVSRHEWEEVVLRGSSLTLLLPLGNQRGHCSRDCPVATAGLTRHALLSSIADFYQVGRLPCHCAVGRCRSSIVCEYEAPHRFGFAWLRAGKGQWWNF